ncbi:RDD family protein [Acidisphaera rubrifaciens]|uniref:RDD domain-containing protein n=1 Tax=Acidisphaera rubrifaciens HS-AP3 TaxID=1231350 RepID=A0A0D6P4Z6_9PROT|nr:RDD family protein [Acidisphaera rubrifaciens]GAN75964.1 hypothetical protein Asru_0033_02 [Acidisphaera rubrifaciens HS-AP3]
MINRMNAYAEPDAVLTRGVIARRIEALLIDLVLMAVLGAVLWVFCLIFGIMTLGLGWPLFHLLPALPFVYTAGFVMSPLSATPGQALRGLAVRRADDLGPPEVWQAVIYTAGYYVTAVTSGLLFLIALVTERRRALHDLAAGVVVVRRAALADGDWRAPPLTGLGGAWNIPTGTWPR